MPRRLCRGGTAHPRGLGSGLSERRRAGRHAAEHCAGRRRGAEPPVAQHEGGWVGKNPGLKKTQPSGFFLGGVLVFFIYLYICPEQRVFRLFEFQEF